MVWESGSRSTHSLRRRGRIGTAPARRAGRWRPTVFLREDGRQPEVDASRTSWCILSISNRPVGGTTTIRMVGLFFGEATPSGWALLQRNDPRPCWNFSSEEGQRGRWVGSKPTCRLRRVATAPLRRDWRSRSLATCAGRTGTLQSLLLRERVGAGLPVRLRRHELDMGTSSEVPASGERCFTSRVDDGWKRISSEIPEHLPEAPLCRPLSAVECLLRET